MSGEASTVTALESCQQFLDSEPVTPGPGVTALEISPRGDISESVTPKVHRYRRYELRQTILGPRQVPVCGCGDAFPGEDHYLQSPECWEADQKALEHIYHHGNGARYATGKGEGYRSKCSCGRILYSTRKRLDRCIRCAITRRANRQRERRAAAKAKEATCEGCGEPFKPKRKDSRFCKGACRQKAYRGRKKVGRESAAT